MDFEALKFSFPNFTEEMWKGNEPCGKGHELVSGGYADRWSFQHGGGETANGEILNFSFSLNHKVTIYIIGDVLNICDNRHDGTPEQWCYCNKPDKGRIYGCHENNLHELEPEWIEKYLNMKFPNCKAWDLVQARAKELYYGGVVE